MMDPSQNPSLIIHLVYSTPHFPLPDEKTLIGQLASFDDHQETRKINATWHQREVEGCWGEVQFGDHHIQVGGLPHPLPSELIDRTIHTSRWGPQIKAAMRQHQSHISLVYIGNQPDPVERMISLYLTANAFENENLLGILNPGAWTAHPPADFLTSEKIRTYRQTLPFNLWVGYVKFFIDKEHYWLVTKGHHSFDVPDLAYAVQSDENPEDIIDVFINIFYYIYEKDVFVTAGDTLSIGDKGDILQFSEVPDDMDYLIGPSGTLVIEKASPDG